MLDKEFVSTMENVIRFAEEQRDDDIDRIERQFINDAISEPCWERTIKQIWKQFNDVMLVLCDMCVYRDASNEELLRLFGEDYKSYLSQL